MAYIRKRGQKWQATVRLPNGDRRCKTDRLKSVVMEWAADLEADARRGEAIDPRAGEVTVGDLWGKVRDARRLELASRKRDESHWRCHVQPRWEKVPVGAILEPDVTAWIVSMERAGVGAATIQGAVGVLRAVLRHAVKARLIRANPAARGELELPRRDAHLDRVLAPEEDGQLLAAVDRIAPGRCDGWLLVELMLYCGLRWEEAGAITRERVQLRYAILDIGPVVERNGTIRPYPKSPAGTRPVPVDEDLWPRVRDAALATEPGGLLVTGPRGGVLDYSHWYHRVWRPALVGLPERPARRGRAHQPAVAGAGLADPQPTPHDLRHTYGTRLAEQGVPPHELMALMGHESLESVQRYVHPGEGRFARARGAVQRGRASNGRQDQPAPSHTQPHTTTDIRRSQH